MGVRIAPLLPKKEVELEDLSGKKIAIDAYNTLYSFLSIIRDKMTGEYLRDSKGRITSHLSGIFYRLTRLIEAGIKPILVFDGEPPEFKRETIEAREEMKRVAMEKWKEAMERGEEAITYAQATARLTDEMVHDSKALLDAMGISWVQAPSEGEAMCAYLCKIGEVFGAGSQDADALLFGSPRLVRNLSITGKRKLPRKEVYIEIKPEIIELEEVLRNLEITREQLIIIGILTGTDYNPSVPGIGPKTALKLVKGCKNLDEVLAKVEWKADVNVEDIYNFFLNPPVEKKYKIVWRQPNKEKIIKFMVDEHDFSLERVEKVVDRLLHAYTTAQQVTLADWLKK
ncbi:MAG: flap endonuclease-1 [Candidatus Aenigmarchaeota archaeon]|nr:flap endonuclease-1 [Candidatus Aenigmarchaeota archaeon]